MSKKVLYCASTAGHLVSFHIPYMKKLISDGRTVHGGGRGQDERLSFLHGWQELPFEKSITSPGNFLVAFRLAKILKREKYDLILVHTSLAAFFVRLAVMLAGKGKTKVVNTVHGYLFDENTGALKRKLLLTAEKITAKCTDRVIVMNRQDMEIAKKYRLSGGDVVFISGMGVDMTPYSPASPQAKVEARRQLQIPDDAFVMVFAAEFSGRKNQSMLISAMKLLPENTVLLLPGRGELLESCKTQAEDLGNRVRLPGFVTDMSKYYMAADICVSSSRSEGLPFNLMEAMACGLPIVATEVKGHEDLVTDGENGYLFPYGDKAAFADAVKKIMTSGTEAMSKAAIDRAQQYALDKVLPETYEKMVI